MYTIFLETLLDGMEKIARTRRPKSYLNVRPTDVNARKQQRKQARKHKNTMPHSTSSRNRKHVLLFRVVRVGTLRISPNVRVTK